jgi:thymidylate synthase (FAD)
MKIVNNKPTHKILAIMAGLKGSNPLQLIESAGRTAYQSQARITNNSAKIFVENIRKLGHESVIEHSSMMVQFNNVSRGFTHELVRHRLAAFTQESTRYVDESDFKIIAPPNKDLNNKLVTLNIGRSKTVEVSFKDWMNLNEQMYRGLRRAGWVPQDARQVLPNAINAQIVCTANFREWRHIFKLRTSPAAHWEIKEVMIKLLKEVQKKVPVIFDDFKISKNGKSVTLK